jgi:hypothetical protein
MILILFVITFFYIFGQNSNSLTHRKARISFFHEQREYQLGTASFIYLFIYLLPSPLSSFVLFCSDVVDHQPAYWSPVTTSVACDYVKVGR